MSNSPNESLTYIMSSISFLNCGFRTNNLWIIVKVLVLTILVNGFFGPNYIYG